MFWQGDPFWCLSAASTKLTRACNCAAAPPYLICELPPFIIVASSLCIWASRAKTHCVYVPVQPTGSLVGALQRFQSLASPPGWKYSAAPVFSGSLSSEEQGRQVRRGAAPLHHVIRGQTREGGAAGGLHGCSHEVWETWKEEGEKQERMARVDVRHAASMQVLDEKRCLRLRREAAVLSLSHAEREKKEGERGRDTPLVHFNKEGYITAASVRKKNPLSSLVWQWKFGRIKHLH